MGVGRHFHFCFTIHFWWIYSKKKKLLCFYIAVGGCSHPTPPTEPPQKSFQPFPFAAHVFKKVLPHMTGDNHQHQQSAHCSLNSIWMNLRHCARLILWWWDFLSNWKGFPPIEEHSWKLCRNSLRKEARSCPHRFSGNNFVCTNISFQFFPSGLTLLYLI